MSEDATAAPGDLEDLRFEVEGGVARITLHRPERLNAFSGAMGRSLSAAYRRCDADDAIRAVVLTGAGRAFCAGADLTEASSAFAGSEAPGFRSAGTDLPAFRVRKPVIAAVNGHAIGIGLTLALQCDLRLFAREARYGVVQVRLGVLPDAYAHWTVPRLVGMARAAELLLTGRRFDGDALERLGVASRVLPAAEVLPAALALARDLAENVAPLSAAASKQLLWQSFELGPDAVEQRETALHRLLMPHADATEGPLAFQERRPPRFVGSVSRELPDEPEGEAEE